MQTNLNTTNRLLSLDFMRGMIMFLLALEAAGLYDVLYDASEGQWIHVVVQQFHHHPWNGLRFWDLIQPGFMFMAGIAMAYSVTGMKSRVFLQDKKISGCSNAVAGFSSGAC